MDIAKLKAELTDDPESIGYSGMDNAAAAAALNTKNRTTNKTSLTGNELFTATDATEFAALTDAKRSLWVGWCNTDRDPFDAANVAFFVYIFGEGSDTGTALGAIRLNDVSRASELGLGNVRAGNVAEARV